MIFYHASITTGRALMNYERYSYPQPFYGTVNVYRIGDTLLDTGHMGSNDRLKDDLRNGPLQGIERVVLTHSHMDHVGGSQTISELATLPHIVFQGVDDILHNFDAYHERVHDEMRRLGSGLPGLESVLETYIPRGDYREEEITIERVVGDGDTVRLGDYECEVVHTPGHATAHMALWHEASATMFSADLISTNGHFMYAALSADIGAYRASLRRLREYDADVLVPGHGPPMDDPDARIDDALTKADETERTIRETIEAATEPQTARHLAREALGASGASVGFLTYVVCAYLDHLESKGVLTVTVHEDGVYAEPTSTTSAL